jgi:KUP system potassium uptake protein
MSAHGPHDQSSKKIGTLILGALGVVFGDIGTSPLYALKVSIEAAGAHDANSIVQTVYGVLSLITWALILVVTLKYVMIIMRADNHGEGGVFALTALVTKGVEKNPLAKWTVMIAGALGAALGAAPSTGTVGRVGSAEGTG